MKFKQDVKCFKEIKSNPKYSQRARTKLGFSEET